ncbi:hypothetical protein, partial [Mariniflexile maritimum]|uniref:hypothetical protein n=1 Tax=Mariniflexile maritimum TaxID=2682493 RepID=UPI0018DCF9C9
FTAFPSGFGLCAPSPRARWGVARAIDGTGKGRSVGAKSAPTQVRVGASSGKKRGRKAHRIRELKRGGKINRKITGKSLRGTEKGGYICTR